MKRAFLVGSTLLLALSPLLFGVEADVPVTFRLLLAGDSVAERLEKARQQPQLQGGMDRGPGRIGREHRKVVEAEHASLEVELGKRGLRGITHTHTVLNSVVVHAPESRLEELRQIPGVRAVERVQRFQRALTSSVPYVTAPEVWRIDPPAGGYTGRGVRLGIIDSGIDYTHADFGGSGNPADFTLNDPTYIEPGTFPTTKVVGGIDLAGDDYDPAVLGSDVPVPDEDPLDPSEAGHGSHVAGIASGLGVLVGGATFNGLYDASVYGHSFLIGPGVAPEADLYAIKIFGRTGGTDLVVEGLDWAADPNGDGDTSDHLDVVNLSLGVAFGKQDGTTGDQAAVKRLATLGCVVVIAAGNEGNTHYIMASPGVAPEAITVANIYAPGLTFDSIHVTEPGPISGDYLALEAGFTPQLSAVGPVEAGVVGAVPLDACAALPDNAADIAGKIALCDRGGCYFSDKVRALQHAGAVGVIVVNNVAGPPIGMSGTGDTSDITIPAIMISQADGEVLKGQLAAGLVVRLGGGQAGPPPDLAGQPEESSSRGPTLYNSRLKPDMAAPGAGILSVQVAAGTGGVRHSGTSMATPHVAGAAALLKQQHPGWTGSEIKSALMNSSVPCVTLGGRRYPETWTGAGRLDALAASRATVLARVASLPAEASLSYGSFEVSTATTSSQTLQLVNKGPQLTLDVAVSNSVAQPGVTFTPAFPRITVPANGTTNLSIRLSIDPTQLRARWEDPTASSVGGVPFQPLGEASGQIHFLGGPSALHVPFLAVVRALSSGKVGVPTLGIPADGRTTVRVPVTLAAGGGPEPLVSVFEYGASSPNQGLTFPNSAMDILAVGAANDLGSAGSVDAARVFFGLAVAGKWITPQRAFGNLDIEIDLNNDGIPDYTVASSTQGNISLDALEYPPVANDAFQTAVYVGKSGDSPATLTPGEPWNVLPPSFRDTAPFHNSVVVHGVHAKDIGLTATRTKFRYRGRTFGPANNDQTAWVTYDIARPQLDPTRRGLLGSPFFDSTNGMWMDVIRSNAPAGATSIRALVLHQHNKPGAQVETVTFRFDTADYDGNGLPDAWESTYFGRLGNAPADDPDHDGATNAQEAVAGTNPLDAASVFRLLSAAPASPGPGNIIRWLGTAGVKYSVERSASLSAPFTPVASGVVGVAGTNSFTDGSAPEGAVFYRLRIP